MLDIIMGKCYNEFVEANGIRGVFVSEDAVLLHNPLVAPKAPFLFGLTSHRSLRQRRQNKKGVFAMEDKEAIRIMKQGVCPMDYTPCEYLAKHGKINCTDCISPSKKTAVKKPEYKKVHIPMAVRYAVMRRDNFTCQQCGSQDNLSIDHITPERAGGKATVENCRILCRSCNSKKG